jgi:hypothetical protein
VPRERRQTGPGGVAIKRCPVCHRDVLSAFRGEVTAVGKGEIQSVSREGHVIGKCACGKHVVWEGEVSRAR